MVLIGLLTKIYTLPQRVSRILSFLVEEGLGTLPVSNIEIAVKRVSHDSRQGMREFIAEIATIGRLRHPNLVRLQGYCRRKGELYLVYDCMPKGSVDKFLYHQQKQSLNWSQRFKIIKDGCR